MAAVNAQTEPPKTRSRPNWSLILPTIGMLMHCPNWYFVRVRAAHAIRVRGACPTLGSAPATIVASTDSIKMEVLATANIA